MNYFEERLMPFFFCSNRVKKHTVIKGGDPMKMIDVIRKTLMRLDSNEYMTLAEKRSNSSKTSKGYAVQLDLTSRKKNKYYPEIHMLVNSILSGADELLEYDASKYIDSVARIKAEIPEDYADRVLYDKLSETSIRQCVERLSDYDDEIGKYLSLEQIEAERKKGIEIGRQSLSVLGADSVSKLDVALREEREKKEQQTNEKIKSIAAGMSAIKGDRSALADIFNKMSETSLKNVEAVQTDSDVHNKDNEGTSDEGVNPKGEE